MEEKDFNGMLEVLAKGTELNLGVPPDTNVVKYGYYCVKKELTLYLQASGGGIGAVKNYLGARKEIHFNKWSGNGKFISGCGNAAVLEKEEEKRDGLKIIMKQQAGNESVNNIDNDGLNDLFIFKLSVQNVNVLKY